MCGCWWWNTLQLKNWYDVPWSSLETLSCLRLPSLEWSTWKSSAWLHWWTTTCRGAAVEGWRVLKHPQPKNSVPCNSVRSDDFFLLGGGVLALALLWTHPLFHYSLLKPTRIRRPACLYFKIHRQLTIVEVLSEGTLLMSVAEIHINGCYVDKANYGNYGPTATDGKGENTCWNRRH